MIPRENNHRRLWIPAALAALLCSLCLLTGCGSSVKAVPGVKIEQDASFVDLTQTALTPEEYEALQAARPTCDIRWSVPLLAGSAPSDSEQLWLSSFCEEDAALLAYFPKLITLEVTGEADYAALIRAQAAYPDCRFHWTVFIGSQAAEWDAAELELSGEALDIDTLRGVLSGLPRLKRVYLFSTGLDARALEDVMADYPQVAFRADVSLFGETYPSTSTELDFSGRSALSADELIGALPYFTQLVQVNLTGCGVTEEDKDRLAAAAPGVLFIWEVTLAEGASASSRDAIFDLSAHTVTDLDDFMRQFAFCKRAAYADMSHCGLDNAQMEQLQAAFPQVKFVWVVTVGAWEFRTDIQGFSTAISKQHGNVKLVGKANERFASLTNETAAPLKYCTELIALDLSKADRLTDISFVKSLSKLQYLVLSNTAVEDISPVSGLTELVFLEAYRVPESLDISPAATLPKLQYFNCSGVQRPDVEALKAMTSLVRLWTIKCALTDEEVAAVAAALPGCTVRAAGPHVSASWYYHNATYAAMQSIFGLPLEGQRKE